MSRAAVIPIHSDNGYDCCPVCKHCESEVCDGCDLADKFELDPEASQMQTFGPLTAVSTD